MPSQLTNDQVKSRPTHPAQIRLQPLVNLVTGQEMGALFQSRNTFEERASFGPMAATGLPENPAKWTAQSIEELGRLSERSARSCAPVLLPIPMSALAHSNTGVACDAAVRRTSLCHQEIVLEISDAAFAGDRLDHLNRVAHLRRHGFNAGVDMRKSWTAPLDGALRILVDYIRIDAEQLSAEPSLESIVLVARESGINVVAENALWREGAYLAQLGISAAIRPRADA